MWYWRRHRINLLIAILGSHQNPQFAHGSELLGFGSQHQLQKPRWKVVHSFACRSNARRCHCYRVPSTVVLRRWSSWCWWLDQSASRCSRKQCSACTDFAATTCKAWYKKHVWQSKCCCTVMDATMIPFINSMLAVDCSRYCCRSTTCASCDRITVVRVW